MGITTWTCTGRVNQLYSNEENSPLWEKFQNLQKVSQLKSLSNHMVHYQNENTFSLGKSISEVIILTDGKDLWRKWLVVRERHFKANGLSSIESTRKLFFFPKPVSRSSHTQKLALSPQRASALINNVDTERSGEHLEEVMSHGFRVYYFPL